MEAEPDQQLPMKSFVLFIACGTLVFIIVFLFAKRQITRYALKSSRSPHANIGSDAPKALRQEIERRLKRIADIQFEPRLLCQSKEDSLLGAAASENCPQFFYRMKAVDALAILDGELKLFDENIKRPVGAKLIPFLGTLQMQGPLEGISQLTVERFVAFYDHARHDPSSFKRQEYECYMRLLNEIIQHIRNKRNNADFGRKTVETISHEIGKGSPAKDNKLILKIPMHSAYSSPGSNVNQNASNSKDDSNNQTMSDKDSAIQVTYRPSVKDGQGNLKMTARTDSQSSQEHSSISSGADRLSLVSSQSSGHFETSV